MSYAASLFQRQRGRRLVAAYSTLSLAALGLVAASTWSGAPAPAPPTVALLLLLLLTAAAALHAPFGARSLGFGAAALPLSALYFGILASGLAAATAVVLARVTRHWVLGQTSREEPRNWLETTAAAVGRVVLATLAAAAVWRLLDPGGEQPDHRAMLLTGLAAATVYLLMQPALDLVTARWTGEPFQPRAALVPLTLDLVGWALGLAIAGVALLLGWPVGLALLGGLAILVLEAARNARQRLLADRRVRELQAIHLAGHRIIVRHPDLLGIAEQIHVECRRVLPFHWFQFELHDGAAGRRSWFAGPDRKIEEGEPDPPVALPKLPGIHRRSGWRLLERELAAGDESLATLRLWCDPRRLDEASLELLDSLVPQMASSVQRALLDRDAKRDPLTDLPDRRSFENRLARVFDECRELGEPMAVLLCDVDSFKSINDRSGHAMGDEALLHVAKELESHRRETDLCSRYGGDEFALVLERTDGVNALAIAERLRQAVAARGANLDIRLPLRLSVGVAAFPELPVPTPADLVQLADEALYEAKRRGRNRVLLNLGRDRFQTVDGTVLDDHAKTEIEPPTLFS